MSYHFFPLSVDLTEFIFRGYLSTVKKISFRGFKDLICVLACMNAYNRRTDSPRGPSAHHVVNAVLEVPLFPIDEENKCQVAFWLTMVEKWIQDSVPPSMFFFICSRIRFCLRMQFVDGETYLGFVHPFNITYVRLVLLLVLYRIPASYLGSVRLMFYDTSSRLVIGIWEMGSFPN